MKHPTQYTVRLSRAERRHCQDITRKGRHPARVITRARILLGSDEGIGKDTLASLLRIGRSTVQRIRDRFAVGGCAHALAENPRSGKPRLLDDTAEAHLVALACSDPPDGADHWTLDLLRERMIGDKKVTTVSTVTLWHRLNEHALQPWREKNVVYSDAHSRVHRTDGGHSRSLRETV